TGCGLCLTAFLARSLGAKEFGVYAWVLAISQLLEVPAALGFPTAVVRLVSQYQALGNESRAAAAARYALPPPPAPAGGVACVAFAPVALLASRRELQVGLGALILGLLLVPIGAYLSVLQGVCRAYQRIALALVPAQVVAPILVLAAGAIASWLGPELRA